MINEQQGSREVENTIQPKHRKQSTATGMNNLDLLAVRSYVTGRDETNYDDVSADTVIVDVTHSNLQQKHIEIRFSKSDLLHTLRTKIYRQTGTSPNHQHIQVFYNNDIVGEIPVTTCGDTYKIGYFISQHGMRIHVVDTNPLSISANRALEDVSQVKKFALTDDEYNVRDKTLRRWKNEQKEMDPTFTLQKHAIRHSKLQEALLLHKRGLPLPSGFEYDDQSNQVIFSKTLNDDDKSSSNSHSLHDDVYGADSVQHCIVGQRCQIRIGERRGTIVWTGVLQNHETGYWVGIQLDEPTGKNDGTINGVTYFSTDPNYGAFVRGVQVDVGDFPVKDDIWDEDDSDDEI